MLHQVVDSLEMLNRSCVASFPCLAAKASPPAASGPATRFCLRDGGQPWALPKETLRSTAGFRVDLRGAPSNSMWSGSGARAPLTTIGLRFCRPLPVGLGGLGMESFQWAILFQWAQGPTFIAWLLEKRAHANEHKTNERTNKQTNKQTHKHTNTQTHRHGLGGHAS